MSELGDIMSYIGNNKVFEYPILYQMGDDFNSAFNSAYVNEVDYEFVYHVFPCDRYGSRCTLRQYVLHQTSLDRYGMTMFLEVSKLWE
jgi:hypothetical protein